MLQRLIVALAIFAALSVSIGSGDASAGGHRGGLGGAGQLGNAGTAWHGSSRHGAPSGWHGGRALDGGKGFGGWHADRQWRGANVGWGFYDPFIGYPIFGYPYAESPNVLQCFRR